jgi:hypothetical protein
MKKPFVFGIYAVLAFLLTLVFPACPVEDEIISEGTTIRLTNVPNEVLEGNGFVFLAVFSEKSKIKGKGNSIMQPLTGYESNGLKLNYLRVWLNGNTISIPSFGESIVNGKEYVLVLGLSPKMDESNGGTYTTTGNGDYVAPVTLHIIKGIAEIDFSQKFVYTNSRDELVDNIKNGVW